MRSFELGDVQKESNSRERREDVQLSRYFSLIVFILLRNVKLLLRRGHIEGPSCGW